jgi:hypothetical protein
MTSCQWDPRGWLPVVQLAPHHTLTQREKARDGGWVHYTFVLKISCSNSRGKIGKGLWQWNVDPEWLPLGIEPFQSQIRYGLALPCIYQISPWWSPGTCYFSCVMVKTETTAISLERFKHPLLITVQSNQVISWCNECFSAAIRFLVSFSDFFAGGKHCLN